MGMLSVFFWGNSGGVYGKRQNGKRSDPLMNKCKQLGLGHIQSYNSIYLRFATSSPRLYVLPYHDEHVANTDIVADVLVFMCPRWLPP